MTQQQVSRETLVRLAQERTLSTVFENAWQERTGVNPVAVAIQMSEQQRGGKGWLGMIMMMFLMIILMGVLFAEIVSMVKFLPEDARLAVMFPAFISFGCAVLFMVYVGFLSRKWLARNPPIVYNMDEFLADLNSLCGWFHPKFLSMDVLLSSNEGVVKFAAHSLLVSEAISLVKLEQEKGGDAVERLRRVCEMDLLRKSFTNKYDTLARLGLASGGFDKYFKEAKRQVKVAKAEALQGSDT